MNNHTREKTRYVVECAVMLGLAFVLSNIKLFPMPLGGSVTPAAMLPVMLLSVKYRIRGGLPAAFLYSFLQLFAGLGSSVFSYCETAGVAVMCVLFDYILPYTALGTAGAFAHRADGSFFPAGAYIGIVMAVFLRFLCHFISGVTIWRQVDSEPLDAIVFSVLYNGGYLLPDLLIAILVSIPLLSVRNVRKALGISDQFFNFP